jgi:hypothetical protein
MTEAEFNTCTDPQALLAYLCNGGRVGDRKAGLFGVACCRRLLDFLADPLAEKAVRLREDVADGLGSVEELNAALTVVQDRANAQPAAGAIHNGMIGVVLTAGALPPQPMFWLGLHSLANAVGGSAAPGAVIEEDDWASPHDPRWRDAKAAERAAQATLLRDLFNPFHSLASPDAWRTLAVVALANSIYDDRRWEDMPILGDALQEAGCDDAEVLAHCRGTVHARGCWLVDLLLNKE